MGRKPLPKVNYKVENIHPEMTEEERGRKLWEICRQYTEMVRSTNPKRYYELLEKQTRERREREKAQCKAKEKTY